MVGCRQLCVLAVDILLHVTVPERQKKGLIYTWRELGWREETSLFGEEVGGEGWMEGTSSGQSPDMLASQGQVESLFVVSPLSVCSVAGVVGGGAATM